MDIKKHRISCWFRICWKSFEKMHTKKAETWRKYALFTLLLMFVKLVLLITFLYAFFNNFLNGSKISVKFCVFWCLFWLFQNKNFYGHISTFWKLWSQTHKKWLKKSKIVFSKCVLDFNFAPTKGFLFFIF